MPSWNLHCAHAQYVLDNYDYKKLGIEDPNCFVFGNYVPDIYVGYMVQPITKTIRYTTTHFAVPETIPIPSYNEFWDVAIQSSLDLGHRVDDIVLGTWAHLVADNIYNTYTKIWLKENNVPEGEHARVMKQGDFEKYGRTLSLKYKCEPSIRLLKQSKGFCMYSIEEVDVRASVEVANSIVDRASRYDEYFVPDYELFTSWWFEMVSTKVNNKIIEGLELYASLVK